MTPLLLLLLLQTPAAPTEIEILPIINPNTSTKAELMAVDKAVTSEVADKIIAGRPYSSHDGVRSVIGEELWRKIFNFPIPYSPPPPKAKKREELKIRPPLPKDYA